jgi:hypothetical protein
MPPRVTDIGGVDVAPEPSDVASQHGGREERDSGAY